MSETSNKRTETRNRCFVPVESERDPSFDDTQTVDISCHGIGFISSHRHSINEKIAIEVQLKPHTDPILIVGIVKWVRRLADLEHYRIGMNYDEIMLGSQKRLDRYFAS